MTQFGEKRIITFQQMGLGNLNIHMQNNEIEHLPNPVYKKTNPKCIKT
jgi:hypothetical protein